MLRILLRVFLLAAITWAFMGPQSAPADDADAIVGLLELVIDADAESAQKCLTLLTDKIQSRELVGARLDALRPQLAKMLASVLNEGSKHRLYSDAVVLLATLKEPAGLPAARSMLAETSRSLEQRRRSLEALLFVSDDVTLAGLARQLQDDKASREWRGFVLNSLGRSEDVRVASAVLASYSKLDAELQPKAIELLTQRAAWSRALLEAIGGQQIPATALNANQVAKLMASRDEELVKLVRAKWGSVRTERNPQREQVLVQVREQLAKQPGDARRGHEVFKKVCGQCHKIYGEGQDVGPDVTANGRASFDQLLSNVLDPSLVIGVSYQARTVITDDGRVLTGLLVEDNAQRVVLKMQGGKVETIAREDIDEMKISQLSLMPEGLETQLKPQELIDLFHFLSLDKPPTDPQAKLLPGAKLANP